MSSNVTWTPGPPVPEGEGDIFAPDQIPDEVQEYDEVVNAVDAIAAIERKRERLLLFMKAKLDAYAAAIEWQEQRIHPYALAYRDQTEQSELPVPGGRITIRRKPPRVFRDEEAIAKWAEEKGLTGNPEFEKRSWRFGEIQKLVKWGKANEIGAMDAYDPETGEIVPGFTKQIMNEYSVSVKIHERRGEESDDHRSHAADPGC